MLICCNAEHVRGQRKVGNPGLLNMLQIITQCLFFKTKTSKSCGSVHAITSLLKQGTDCKEECKITQEVQCGRISKYAILQIALMLDIYGVKTVSKFLNMTKI